MPKSSKSSKTPLVRVEPQSDSSTPNPTEPNLSLITMWRVSLIASLLIYAFLQVLWVTVTPLKPVVIPGALPHSNTTPVLVGTGPDETEHYVYVLSMSETGRIPKPNQVLRKSANEYVSHEAQHPPLFYVLAGIVRNLVKASGDTVVWYVLRGLGALLGAVAIWLISWAALIAFPNRPLIPVATPVFLAMLPMFNYMCSELSNFPLELLFTSLGWLLMVRLARGQRPLDAASGTLLALYFGLAAMTRQTSSMWIPAVAIVLCFVALGQTGEARKAAIAGAATFAVLYIACAAPWFLYMKATYGSFFFRSDYRPMLANTTLLNYLAHSTAPIAVPNMPHPVHCSAMDTVLWYATTGWMPYWIAQFEIPAFFGTPQAFESLFLILDVAVVLALFRHWSNNRHAESPERDPCGRILLWSSGCSIAVTIVLVLQQQLHVDIEMFLYYGRYGLTVVAASTLILLFALSTLVGKSARATIVATAVFALAMLLFNGWTYGLLHGFYAPQAIHP